MDYNDIIGKEVGKLTVIQYDKGVKKYLCKCDCGKDHFVARRYLLSNSIKSCGCTGKHLIDITGKKFGYLTVLSYDKSKKQWLCVCDCGRETYAKAWDLKHGYRKSCGCKTSRLIDLQGKRFGMLQVVQRASSIVCNDAQSVPLWLCICDCGNALIANSRSLTRGSRFGCPECQKMYNKNKRKKENFNVQDKQE